MAKFDQIWSHWLVCQYFRHCFAIRICISATATTTTPATARTFFYRPCLCRKTEAKPNLARIKISLARNDLQIEAEDADREKGLNGSSVTSKKLTNVYKSCPKWFWHLYKNCLRMWEIAQSGHTCQRQDWTEGIFTIAPFPASFSLFLSCQQPTS